MRLTLSERLQTLDAGDTLWLAVRQDAWREAQNIRARIDNLSRARQALDGAIFQTEICTATHHRQIGVVTVLIRIERIK